LLDFAGELLGFGKGFGIVSTVVVLGLSLASEIGMNLPVPESRPRLFTICSPFENLKNKFFEHTPKVNYLNRI
jgi:hypothetical protein